MKRCARILVLSWMIAGCTQVVSEPNHSTVAAATPLAQTPDVRAPEQTLGLPAENYPTESVNPLEELQEALQAIESVSKAYRSDLPISEGVYSVPATAVAADPAEAELPATEPAETAEDFAGPNALRQVTLARLHDELVELKVEVQRLHDSFEFYSGPFVDDLKSENARLRNEVRRLRGLEGAPPDTELAGAQIPGAAPTEETVEPLTEEAPIPSAPPALANVNGINYSVVTEWGRSPEDARDFGKDVTSLKGMVCVVPSKTKDDDLIALGRWLRQEHADYDNINIEVFDDLDAAKTYAEQNSAPGDHRVLSVSKHRSSGRDLIILTRGESPRELSPGP
ncbi:MAG: hypothetical protein HY706_19190 [Candidatus Hydrogenedentes bacterium]|nr:hypothetical protein [Candidatus Hydrogenedentota bacterium]